MFAIQFPPSMAADVSALLSAVHTDLIEISDFIATPNLSTWNAWNAVPVSSAATVVRHDLGLPPAPIQP